ncbi:MAG: S8 family peptidase [Undibacterium sp.]|nr:S8 family peptidase [Opitutaceae bacterium]
MPSHFIVTARGQRFPYSYPGTVVTNPTPRPPRNRAAHGAALRDSFQAIQEELRPEWEARDRSADFGVHLEFAGDLGYALETDKLDLRTSGIELVNTRDVVVAGDESIAARTCRYATVFVPYDKLPLFIRKTDAYLTRNGIYRDRETGVERDTGPRNAALIESISEVRRAVVSSFWTESEPFPDPDTPRWWEVWLRVGSPRDNRGAILQCFITEADCLGLRCKGTPLELPEQVVLLVFGSAHRFAESADLLSCLAELRLPATTAAFFAELGNRDAQRWVQAFAPLMRPAGAGAPAVCLLDTGVNRDHPLLTSALPLEHCDTVVPGVHADNDGHGTMMAGLALLGDLTESLQGNQPVQLEHGLESVKVLPDPPRANEPETWGSLTKEAVYRAAIFAPNRARVVNLTIAALEGRNGGKPSAWSTALDQIAAGVGGNGLPKQLVVTSAGNATREEPNAPLAYPRSNRGLAIHNPGQAWNALTVGACTDKVRLTQPGIGDPIAPRGGLAPCSATSIIWDSQWPIKPEIVCEGGNCVRSPANTADLPDDLQLVTTGRNFLFQPLVLTGDTSAATSLASRMCARLQARYPDAWPETIRALMVHFAEWKPAMLDNRDPWRLSEAQRRDVLRQVGYGVPNFDRAAASGTHRVTLLIQDELQPFHLHDGSIRTHDFKRHELPWPTEILQGLLNTQVTLRTTLSYFIEPNPGPRDVDDRFRYGSAGLRFDLQRAGESPTAFARRTSRGVERAPTDPAANAAETGQWLIGRLGERGSLHHDLWRGTAADLAARAALHVYPVTGWWRYRKHLNRSESRLRYALVVTIETPPETPEIYTPISQLIAVANRTPVAIDLGQ